MPIVIGDTHGCFKTFQALLKKLPDEQLYLTGDLIDRGPRVKELVQWVMDHQDICKTVTGNHERMMLACYEKHLGEYDSPRIWRSNGGTQTLKSYFPDKVDFDFYDLPKLPEDQYAFLRDLPLTIEDGKLIISHAGYCSLFKWAEVSLNNDVHKDSQWGLTWFRGNPGKVPGGKFHVFGHTPEPEPTIWEHAANIDTGCCYTQFLKDGIYGKLTALQYPSMEIFSQEYLD